jgi:hypothetical protein
MSCFLIDFPGWFDAGVGDIAKAESIEAASSRIKGASGSILKTGRLKSRTRDIACAGPPYVRAIYSKRRVSTVEAYR